MRIAIVGPTHPYKGGIAKTTTELAHRLQAGGHEVELVSWRTQYPFFYPGQQFVPEARPELPVHPNTKRVLSWKNPVGWWREATRLKGFDKVIFIWWVPTIQGPVYRTMLAALRGKNRPHISVICHNVLPHEGRPGDRALARTVLGRADSVIVHTPAQAELAAELTNAKVETLTLPMIPLPEIQHKTRNSSVLQRQLLFFGIIRDYKGVDVLLKAMAELPDVRLIVAGEFWQFEKYDKMLYELDLTERVALRNGYVPEEELPSLFAKCDAVVLPYRHGTGSFQAKMAFTYGVPVIATTAGPLKQQIRDGVDGLLCEPENAASLALAIRRFYEPGVAEKLRKGIERPSPDKEWRPYIKALEIM